MRHDESDVRVLGGHDAWRKLARLLLRAGCWLIVVAAVPLGAVGAAVSLIAVVAVGGSRELGGIVAGVAVMLSTGGLTWLATLGISRRRCVRRWLPASLTGLTLTAVGAVTWLLVFTSGPPPMALTATQDTRYWHLPTGSRIAYTRVLAQGERKATPVILVHGGPGAPGSAQPGLVATLTRSGFDVYEYHQVGAGLSGRVEHVREYTVARHVADLEAIRRTIRADRVVLVGGSWGGQLIVNYLAAHPERVARAVVASPGPIWAKAFRETESLTAAGRQDQQARARAFPRFILAHVLLNVVSPQTVHALLPDRQMDGVFQAFVGRLDMRAGCPDEPLPKRSEREPRGLGFWVNAMTGRDTRRITDPRARLRGVSTPVMVLRGECDYMAWEVTREYRDLLPNAVLLVIEDAGHTIAVDQPELSREIVRAFLLGEPLPLEPYKGDQAP